MQHERIILPTGAPLDVYSPRTCLLETPLRRSVLICPGGAYRTHSPREAEPIALKFLEDGYNVFVIYYSVAPHRFPNQIREVAATLELIHKNTDIWHCDTEKIGIIGFSAGGHLAAHYSTMYNCKEVREVFPQSKPVQASILSYPVISVAFPECHMGSFKNLLGHEPTEREEIEYFSCEYNVTKKTPPAFIWHTAADTCVPVKNSLAYAQALSDHKVPFELHIYPFGHHGLSTCDDQSADNVTDVLKYDSRWITDAKKWLRMILDI